MKERTERLLDGQPLKSWISTFHSLCVRLLRREAAAAGLSRDFVIYDEDDQLQAVREALKALDLSEKLHPPRRLLSRISAVKNSGRDPEDPAGDSVGAQTLARVAERYREILHPAQALDFDDLLLRTVLAARRERGGARALPPALPLRAGRRVPGHEPRAVRPGPPPVPPAGQRDGGRRRGPVDLLLARRRHPQHPRLREGLPGRARAAPGGELPLHPGHPGPRGRPWSPTT